MSDESKQQAQQPEQQPAPETTAVKPEIGAKLEIDLEKQCAEYKLGWQRAVADYQNLQKEIASRRAELVSMSEQQILEEFIPVYDNFKKAFSLKPASEGKQTQSWINGIGFIMQYFAGVLKSHKVEEIKTVGTMLDTKLHEAVGEEDPPAGGDHPHGTILKEVEGGYTMNGRVVKVAKVIISK